MKSGRERGASVSLSRSQFHFEAEDQLHPNNDRTLSFLRSFSFVWCCMIFICDIYAICSAVFWFGAEGFPRGNNIIFGMLDESLLIIDFFLRLYAIRFKSGVFSFLQIYQNGLKASACEGALNFLSVVPYEFILSRSIDYSDDQANIASYFEVFKFLRIRSIRVFLSRTQDFLIHNDFQLLLSFALLKTFLTLLLFSHLAACLLMIVDKFQRSSLVATSEEHLDRPLTEIYVDSMLWAICSMEGDNLGEYQPVTTAEIIVIELTMLFGAFFYAHIFGDFHLIISFKRKELIERKKKFDDCKEFCVEKGLPAWIKQKVKHFYTMDLELYNEVKNFDHFSQLPVSLQTEIALIHNEDMIRNVKLFGLSSPSFILAISKQFRPKFAMKGDIVLRPGEVAEEFFFIQKGIIEIRATDNVSLIATMEVGCYFGEIGLLLTGRSTVYIYTLTDCVFQTISKDKFESIMNLFPDQRDFLMNVAKQRMATTNPEDLQEPSPELKKKDLKRQSKKIEAQPKRTHTTSLASKQTIINQTFEIPADPQNLNIPIFSFSGSDLSLRYDRYQKEESLNASKAFEESMIQTAAIDIDLKNFIIFPTSWLFKVWFSIIAIGCFYNLFYVPFSIAFEVDLIFGFLICDIITFSIFFLDSIFYSRTSFKDKDDYVKKPEAILLHYFNNYLLIDLFSFLPTDYLLFLCGSTGSFMRWLRILRLLKLFKLWRMGEIIEGNNEKTARYQNLIRKLVVFFYLNHLYACLMYSVCILCFNRDSLHSMIGVFNTHALSGQTPLEQSSLMIRYLNFLYFSLGVASGGSYGDIHPKAFEEKIFHILGLFFFPINFSFLAADVMELASTSESALNNHLSKVDNIRQWMDHLKLPHALKARVNRYHDHLWDEFKGIEDREILEDLPGTLKNEILLFLFRK